PDHPAFQAVLREAGIPLAAPSANTAGRPSPTTASHVVTDLAGRIDAVLDGGPCRVGVESTVVSLAVSPPRLLRPGGVSLEQLRDVLGDVEVDPALVGELAPGVVPGAPGMKYRHYAPTAPVTIINGSRENAIRWLTSEGESGTAVLCFDEEVSAFSAALPGAVVVPYGPENDPATLARRLFDVLRTLDETPNVTAIYARCPSRDDGLYRAVRNRLFKAAAFTEVDTDDI
ncbi:MAG: Sua5/YciO/YrdC/YwlC family protein, partial [Cellulomonadaceae bacterium]|nr:Sua5/YciO/YrdC/YwlC family protein [Cellulomonadaceae bacterium]